MTEKQAKIEIYSKTILEGFDSQHMFIIYTAPDKTQEIIRGGTKNQNFLIDDLWVVRDAYIQRTPIVADYLPPEVLSTRPRVTYIGTESQMKRIFEKMWEGGQMINAAGYDYKLPLGHVQNSNLVVKVLAEYGGLKFVKPKYKDGSEVSIPGIDGELKHTFADYLIQHGANYGAACNIDHEDDDPACEFVKEQIRTEYAQHFQNLAQLKPAERLLPPVEELFDCAVLTTEIISFIQARDLPR